MPSVVFCDNADCYLYDCCYGECDAEKLVVRHGVCAGSTVLGRNVSENDLDEQLKSENEKLRQLVAGLWQCTESAYGPGVECDRCPLGETEGAAPPRCEQMMRELGIETK